MHIAQLKLDSLTMHNESVSHFTDCQSDKKNISHEYFCIKFNYEMSITKNILKTK